MADKKLFEREIATLQGIAQQLDTDPVLQTESTVLLSRASVKLIADALRVVAMRLYALPTTQQWESGDSVMTFDEAFDKLAEALHSAREFARVDGDEVQVVRVPRALARAVWNAFPQDMRGLPNNVTCGGHRVELHDGDEVEIVTRDTPSGGTHTGPTHLDFHAHLDTCKQCRNNPFDLCPTGSRVLQEVAQAMHARAIKF